MGVSVSVQPVSLSGMLVIAHRGASGHRPEHTLAAYELGARLGADYLEPDLVSTADGVLVARHEPEIGATTDVGARPEFADRRTTKRVDGVDRTGWFVEDFTLAELKTLRAVERIPRVRPSNATYDGRFEVPTLTEILALRARLSAELGREIGVYPETKHPTYFARLGLALEAPLVAELAAAGLNSTGAPVFVQSFEQANLRLLRGMTPLPLVQLIAADGPLCTPAGLIAVSRYAAAVGPAKELVLRPGRLVADAHAAGLAVHAWTFRDEARYAAVPGGPHAEYAAARRAGVDGVFTDHPATAVAARLSPAA